jgi:hypothetical protein
MAGHRAPEPPDRDRFDFLLALGLLIMFVAAVAALLTIPDLTER